MNWEELGPNLSFTVENKASHLHKIKAAPISNTMNEVLHYLKFKEFINKLEKAFSIFNLS